MSCNSTRERISSLLDCRIASAEREKVFEHLKTCEACSERYDSLRNLRDALGQMSQAPMPPDLTARLRVTASRERVRQQARASVTSRLRAWASHARLHLGHLMRPVVMPFAGGLASALILFALLVPNLSFAHHLFGDDPAVSLVTIPDGKVVGLIGEVPSIEPIDTRSSSDGTVVELTIDQKGRVRYYSVVHGALTHDMESIILFSYFTPATVFGQPSWGKVLLSLRPVRGNRS